MLDKIFSSKKIFLVLLILPIGLAILLSFELGLFLTKEKSQAGFNTLLLESTSEAARLEKALGFSNGQISELNKDLENELQDKNQLQAKISKLEGEVAGMSVSRNHPFSVPTDGTVGTFNGTFGGNMYGFRHLGIDIWTTTENSGAIPAHKGNPVYAACDGQVSNVDPNNGAVLITCKPIDNSNGKYSLPEYQVYTYYAHMGHAETKELYISVHRGQIVSKGDQIGYQGDLSSFFPDMRNVHLHFSVFTGLSETDKNGGALNPCLYIGGDCSRAGERFKVVN